MEGSSASLGTHLVNTMYAGIANENLRKAGAPIDDQISPQYTG